MKKYDFVKDSNGKEILNTFNPPQDRMFATNSNTLNNEDFDKNEDEDLYDSKNDDLEELNFDK